MFALREPYRAPIARIRVGGSVFGGDFYKDDQGGLWKFEYRTSAEAASSMSAGGGFGFGQTRASTDQYGGVTTDWYDQSVFNSHPDALNADIESKAIAYGAAVSDAVDGGSSDSKLSSGITSRPTKAKPKPSGGGGGGGGGSLSSAIDESTTPAAASAAGSNTTFVIILGMLGAGVIAWKLLF